jgi:hypothetical protein
MYGALKVANLMSGQTVAIIGAGVSCVPSYNDLNQAAEGNTGSWASGYTVFQVHGPSRCVHRCKGSSFGTRQEPQIRSCKSSILPAPLLSGFFLIT